MDERSLTAEPEFSQRDETDGMIPMAAVAKIWWSTTSDLAMVKRYRPDLVGIAQDRVDRIGKLLSARRSA